MSSWMVRAALVVVAVLVGSRAIAAAQPSCTEDAGYYLEPSLWLGKSDAAYSGRTKLEVAARIGAGIERGRCADTSYRAGLGIGGQLAVLGSPDGSDLGHVVFGPELEADRASGDWRFGAAGAVQLAMYYGELDAESLQVRIGFRARHGPCTLGVDGILATGRGDIPASRGVMFGAGASGRTGRIALVVGAVVGVLALVGVASELANSGD